MLFIKLFFRYQDGWPAIWKDADAVIIAYDGDDKKQEKGLEFWFYFYFIFHLIFLFLLFLLL